MTHSNQQVQLLKDIANVLGRTEEKMTVTRLITLLESQPDVQKKLTEARDRLLAAASRMNHLNDQNVALIKQAIELNEFDLTLFKSLRQALRPPIMTKLPAIQEACWAAADLTQ